MKMDLPTGFKLLIAGCVVFSGTLFARPQSGSLTQAYAYIGAPALSVSNLTLGGGVLFEARFDAATFAGDLIARGVAADGSFTPDEFDAEGNLTVFHGLWRARTTVTAQSRRRGDSATDNRIIFTAGDDGTGILEGRRFWWNNAADDALTDAMKAVVNSDTAVAADNDPVTDWTRGYDSSEGVGPTDLRQRTTVLGNLVHGSLAYLGPPSQYFTDSSYAEFRRNHAGRDPLVFTGGGDAMLHAFKAGDGAEVFAYIPREMLGVLKGLTRRDHTERFLVDGSPTTGDARGAFPMCGTGDCWRTILVSGLGVGGRTIFALDVTDPTGDMGDTDKEYNAARNLFLWEFTDPGLGLTTSEPLIAQLGDGTWAAIFGSGRDAGKASLFVVDLAGGTLIEKIEITSAGAGSGLSSPVGWDQNFDDKVDVVYAGDLEGNVWKFDFTQATPSVVPLSPSRATLWSR
jgi:type IV pilus assembly protein PilY1